MFQRCLNVPVDDTLGALVLVIYVTSDVTDRFVLLRIVSVLDTCFGVISIVGYALRFRIRGVYRALPQSCSLCVFAISVES